MKKILKSAVLLAVIVSFSSCATIFTGTKDKISFDSNPQGAKVIIDGYTVCTTPCSTRIGRSLDGQDVQIKLDGYVTQVITLDQKFNAVSILNLGNLLGWGIDALSGSLKKYGRKSYIIDLEKRLSQLDVQTIEVDTEQKVVTMYVMEKN
ncbi:MAG: PEGA domain-containing protein [Bacteroidales bacterium]|jgi:hypothetical protein|nr:PEGA domain-containing protein [Bacteroidales bacterium]